MSDKVIDLAVEAAAPAGCPAAGHSRTGHHLARLIAADAGVGALAWYAGSPARVLCSRGLDVGAVGAHRLVVEAAGGDAVTARRRRPICSAGQSGQRAG